MREALTKFGEINEHLWSLLEAAEMSAADRTTTSHTASEDISDSDQYTTKAEDTLFEISRYLENHPTEVTPVMPIAAPVPSSAKGHKISFRAMTHDDCRLWFAQLEDVFASLGMSSQSNKLFYATYHRHYEQPSNSLRHNYQWTSCCKRQTHCTSRYPPRLFQPSRKFQPN